MGDIGFSWNEYDPRLADLRRAWVAHYMRKGCSEWKARRLAEKKFFTWPPRAP